MKILIQKFTQLFVPAPKTQDPMLRLYLAHLNGPACVMPAKKADR